MSTGRGMLDLARLHIGERYVNVLVPKNNPNWQGPWDCAEFMSWLVFQDSGILYGCLDNTVDPAVADAYTGAWKRDSATRGVRIPVDHAAAIVGGIVLRYPPQSGQMGHIALCDGTGGTVEAKSKLAGVVADQVHGRRWDTGVLVPGIYYDTSVAPLPLVQPAKVYYLGAPNMSPKVVLDIQQRLLDAGFNPGPLDGIYGAKTAAAVAAFQEVNGLVVDGEVGPETAPVLGVTL